MTRTETIVSIGIDWADKLHAFHLIAPNAKPVAGTFEQDAANIRDTI